MPTSVGWCTVTSNRSTSCSQVTKPSRSPWEIANLYAMAGEDRLALNWLERGFEEKDPNMPYLNALPIFGHLHDEPRFQDLVRRMGLPE